MKTTKKLDWESCQYEYYDILHMLSFLSSICRVWKGFRVIRELALILPVNRENGRNTVVIRELYSHRDA